MSAAANGRAHLSIGEVLSLLQEEFPDVTISKIRFLESQGLLDPERTPSGYRKFYDDDIERLRWILRMQKDHYLPLKVIKDRLDELKGSPQGTGGGPAVPLNGASTTGPRLVDVAREPNEPTPAARAARDGHPVGDNNRSVREVRRTPPARGRDAGSGRNSGRSSGRGSGTGAGRTRRSSPAPDANSPTPTADRLAQPTPLRDPTPVVNGHVAQGGPGGPSGFEAGTDAVSLSMEELAEASGLSLRDIRELEKFGLIEPRDGTTSYDGDALIVARTAAGFLQHGIEARHMRTYKVAADREAGLFQQIVSPVLKQRNPEARTRATRTVTELIRLGEVMRGVLLRRELREHIGGG